MADDLIIPFEVVDPEEEKATYGDLIVPFTTGDEPPPPNKSEAELAAEQLQNIPMGLPSVAQADAAMGLTSAVLGPMVSGWAGLAGGAAGLIPGGESPGEKAGRWQAATQEALTYEPKTRQGAKVMQGVGNVMGKVEEGAKFVGSGYAGLGALAAGADAEEATLSMQDFRETPNALAEGAAQMAGDEHPKLTGLAAALASIAPEIASLGLVKPKMAPPKHGVELKNIYGDVPTPNRMIPETGPGGRPIDIPEGYGGVGRSESGVQWSTAASEAVPASEFNALKAAVAEGNARKAAEIINANPALVAAFDELGLAYAPQMVSDSVALRSTASGLKSAPESGLAAMDEFVGTQLKGFADELVNKYGSTNRMDVEVGVREAFDADIRTLNEGVTQLYDDVLNSIPQGARVEAGPMRAYIERRVSDLGAGDIDRGLNSPALSSHERALWDLTHRRVEVEGGRMEWEAEAPSYAEIDAFRRDVGEGLSGTGIYTRNKVGELKNTYAQLAETQQRAANAAGPEVGTAYRQANELGQRLHQTQADSIKVLGRDLEAGMLAKVDTAAGQVVKGNTAGFKKMIEAVPASQREAVAMSVLDRIMTGSAGSERITEVFLKNMTLLNRNPGARNLLFSYLPKEAIRRYKVIETASRGFLRSLAKDNKSNTANANAVVQSWRDGSLWTRLVTNPGKRVPVIHDWVTKLAEAGPANRVAAAEKFLTSPALDKAARLYAQGKQAQADKIAMRSAAYNRWLKTLDDEMRDLVQQKGIMAFLFTSQVEDTQ
jgi:hypothetical protein